MYIFSNVVHTTNSQWTPSFDDYQREINTYPPLLEAPRSAQTAFLGASAMFEGLFLGILGCCQAGSQCLSGFPAFYDFT